VTGFAAALGLLGVVLLIITGLYTAGQLLAVARPARAAVPFAGGLPPTEHAVSRFHVRWYAITMLFLAFDMEMIFMYPWTLVISAVGPSAVIEMFTFLAVLLAGGGGGGHLAGHARAASAGGGSPSGGPDETFRVAGMTNPAIVVPAGARVSIEVINADPGTAHGLVITASTDTTSPMPMMTDRPAFTGSALWFLGNPTSAGMHAGTLTFTAAAPGTYRYLCPVPGHAQKGMAGAFTIK
jgi:NADH-quinone oxidoreductase subunit A